MLIAVLIGYVCAFIVPLLAKPAGRSLGYILSLIPLGIFAFLCTYLSPIINGQVLVGYYEWVPAFGVNLTFRLDGLSLFFALLISFFGGLIFIYSAGYMKGNQQVDRFFMYLLIFMASMLGLVLSSNLISLFIFWELTSFSSYLLIGFTHKNDTARKSALQAFLVTASGGLALLTGFVILGEITGTYELAEILNMKTLVVGDTFYLAAVILILIGAFTKSAQFPFHFWLPNAMAAPTPVSAYLHSATMVKAGIYLIARFTPILGGTDVWQLILMLGGGITMLLGAILAIQHIGLKKILAYTTISALGIMVLMLGTGTPLAIQSAMAFLLAHALYKGALFLITGNLDKQTGTRNVLELSGLYKSMPYTGFATFLACFSMAGVLPFFGFIGKELIYEAALDATFQNIALLVAVILSGIAFVTIAIDISFGIFIGQNKGNRKRPEEAPFAMLAAPLILAGLGLIFGLFAGVLVQPLLARVANVILNQEVPLGLQIWHGFNVVLMLSLLTLLLGFFLYLFRNRSRQLPSSLGFIYRNGPAAIYEKFLIIISRFARGQTRFLQNGYLRNYLIVIASVLVVMLGSFIWLRGISFLALFSAFDLSNLRFYEAITISLAVVALVVFFRTRSRMAAIITMGVVGYAVAIVFILFGAPDVAITQLLIETLTVVLFVLVLHKLPPLKFYSVKNLKYVYAAISIAFGLMMTTILLLVTKHPLVSSLKEYYAENTYLLGQGRNAVNVILVDFRALDTMGEISVLAIAAVGIVALLKLKIVKGNR